MPIIVGRKEQVDYIRYHNALRNLSPVENQSITVAQDDSLRKHLVLHVLSIAKQQFSRSLLIHKQGIACSRNRYPNIDQPRYSVQAGLLVPAGSYMNM